MIKVPKADIDLAKRFEGFERKVKRRIEITAVPYICPAGFWTVSVQPLHLAKVSE